MEIYSLNKILTIFMQLRIKKLNFKIGYSFDIFIIVWGSRDDHRAENNSGFRCQHI